MADINSNLKGGDGMDDELAWELEIHTIDVQQGESSLIIKKRQDGTNSKSILIDGGLAIYGKSIHHYIQDKLTNNKVLDKIVITHFDADHVCGILSLLVSDNISIITNRILNYINHNGSEKSDASKLLYFLYGIFKENELTEIMLNTIEKEAGVGTISDYKGFIENFNIKVLEEDNKLRYYDQFTSYALILNEISNLTNHEKIFEFLSKNIIKYSNVNESNLFYTNKIYEKLEIITPGITSLKKEKNESDIAKTFPDIARGILRIKKGKKDSNCFDNTGVNAICVAKRTLYSIAEPYSITQQGALVPLETKLELKRELFNLLTINELSSTKNNFDSEPSCYLVAGNKRYLNQPKALFADESNETSIALLVRFNNFTFYTAGDLETSHEDYLAEKLLEYLPEYNTSKKITVFKCGHHGSQFSTSNFFLKTLNPQVAIISSGIRNTFLHPHPEVLDRLHRHNCVQCVLLTSSQYRYQIPCLHDFLNLEEKQVDNNQKKATYIKKIDDCIPNVHFHFDDLGYKGIFSYLREMNKNRMQSNDFQLYLMDYSEFLETFEQASKKTNEVETALRNYPNIFYSIITSKFLQFGSNDLERSETYLNDSEFSRGDIVIKVTNDDSYYPTCKIRGILELANPLPVNLDLATGQNYLQKPIDFENAMNVEF